MSTFPSLWWRSYQRLPLHHVVHAMSVSSPSVFPALADGPVQQEDIVFLLSKLV